MAGDPRIDAYIADASPAVREVLEHLRGLVHAAVPGLEETMKWNVPHFTLDGRNVAGLGAFKAHASLGLHGVNDGKGTYIKIVSLDDRPSDVALIEQLQAAADCAKLKSKPKAGRKT